MTWSAAVLLTSLYDRLSSFNIIPSSNQKKLIELAFRSSNVFCIKLKLIFLFLRFYTTTSSTVYYFFYNIWVISFYYFQVETHEAAIQNAKPDTTLPSKAAPTADDVNDDVVLFGSNNENMNICKVLCLNQDYLTFFWTAVKPTRLGHIYVEKELICINYLSSVTSS